MSQVDAPRRDEVPESRLEKAIQAAKKKPLLYGLATGGIMGLLAFLISASGAANKAQFGIRVPYHVLEREFLVTCGSHVLVGLVVGAALGGLAGAVVGFFGWGARKRKNHPDLQKELAKLRTPKARAGLFCLALDFAGAIAGWSVSASPTMVAAVGSSGMAIQLLGAYIGSLVGFYTGVLLVTSVRLMFRMPCEKDERPFWGLFLHPIGGAIGFLIGLALFDSPDAIAWAAIAGIVSVSLIVRSWRAFAVKCTLFPTPSPASRNEVSPTG